MINIRSIKQYALETDPTSIFSKIVAREPDSMPESQFLTKIPIWFTLLEIEGEGLEGKTGEEKVRG